LNQIWAPTGLHGSFDRRVLPADVLKVYPQTEYLLRFTYGVAIDRVEGMLVLSLSTAIADTLLREIDRHDARRTQSPEVKAVLRERLGQLPRRATLRLPSFALRLAEVKALRPGTLLHTGIPARAHAEFSTPGGPVWLATPMKQDGRVAARLLHLAEEAPPGAEG
jgi:flagellar motor switch protein FliM